MRLAGLLQERPVNMSALPPDFEAIRKLSPYEAEYWSARDLAPLLGYTDWPDFEAVIKRAMTASEQVNQPVANHFTPVNRLVKLPSGVEKEADDYLLSRFACYMVAQNGDPSKPAVAQAQVYFAIATRQNELHELRLAQEERLALRERVSTNNKHLADAAYQAGVLSKYFGVFQNAGYAGMYGGLNLEDIKQHKGLDAKEELLDRMGRAELAANDFRITQTEGKLRKEGIMGQHQATEAHNTIGKIVRDTIKEIGGTMPEDLPPEPSIKPLLDERRRARKKLDQTKPKDDDDGTPTQGSLW